MKAVQMKGARWALALVLALVCVVVVALPVLASANTEPETAQVGEVNDKQGDDVELTTNAIVEGDDSESDGDEDGIELVTQEATSIAGKKLDIAGRSPSLSVGEPITNFTQLCYQQTMLAKDADYTIIGYVPKQGKEAPTDEGYNSPSSDTITTPGQYFLIVEGKGSNDSGYSGRGYAEFSVESNNGNNGGNGNGGGNGGGPGDRLNVEVNQNEYTYTGEPINVLPSSVNREGTTLASTDYKVTGYQKVNDDYSRTDLSGAPTGEGKYAVVVEGIGSYQGLKGDVQFSIVKINSLASMDRVAISTDRQYYVFSGSAIKPTVTVTFNGTELVQGTDYTVGYQSQSQGQWGAVQDSVTAAGEYRAVATAVSGGSYTGTRYDTRSFSVVNGSSSLETATLSFAGETKWGNPVVNPTVTWANGSATPPAVTVTSADGTVLESGKDFKFQYQKSGSSEWKDAIVDGEGKYNVGVTEIAGSGYTGTSTGQQNLMFYVAASAHDISKATVTAPKSFTWDNDKDITETLKKEISLTLEGKELTVDEDFDFLHQSPNNQRPGSGVLGLHTLYAEGNVTSAARGQGSVVSGEKYYGTQAITYGVWNDEAPAADQRVDTATGVKVEGSTISDNSTIKTEEWVSFDAAKLDDAALETAEAAKTAKDAAEAAGAAEVVVYEATLEHTDALGNAENMKTDLDISLSFPVDAKYNGKTATITQIHDGKAMDPVTVAIANGQATVPTDRLSEFVIAVSDEPATTTETTAATKASSSDTSKTKLAATGDTVLPMVIGTLIVIAAGAAYIVIASRRRSHN